MLEGWKKEKLLVYFSDNRVTGWLNLWKFIKNTARVNLFFTSTTEVMKLARMKIDVHQI